MASPDVRRPGSGPAARLLVDSGLPRGILEPVAGTSTPGCPSLSSDECARRGTGQAASRLPGYLRDRWQAADSDPQASEPAGPSRPRAARGRYYPDRDTNSGRRDAPSGSNPTVDR